MQSLESEGTAKGHLVPLPCNKQGRLQLEQLAQSPARRQKIPSSNSADQWQRLQTCHTWITYCSLWVCRESNSAARFLPPSRPSPARAARLGKRLGKKSSAKHSVGTCTLCVRGACALPSLSLLPCFKKSVFPLCFSFLPWEQRGRKRGQPPFRCRFRLILVVDKDWSEWCPGDRDAPMTVWKGFSLERRGQTEWVGPALDQKDAGKKGEWKGWNLSFKGIRRKDLESKENSVSTDLSYIVPRRQWFDRCGNDPSHAGATCAEAVEEINPGAANGPLPPGKGPLSCHPCVWNESSCPRRGILLRFSQPYQLEFTHKPVGSWHLLKIETPRLHPCVLRLAEHVAK